MCYILCNCCVKCHVQVSKIQELIESVGRGVNWIKVKTFGCWEKYFVSYSIEQRHIHLNRFVDKSILTETEILYTVARMLQANRFKI